MELRRTLSILGVMMVLVIIKMIIENRKETKRQVLRQRNDFIQWMERHFKTVYINGTVSEPIVGTVIFQYWAGEGIATSYILPDGWYYRYSSGHFVRWPILDEQVAPQAVQLWSYLQPWLVNGVATSGKPMPEQGCMALHWRTDNGWLYRAMPQAETMQLPAWQQITAIDKQVAETYQHRLPRYDRDYIPETKGV